MIRNIVFSLIAVFSINSSGMTPKASLSPEELFNNSSTIVIFQIESGEYKYEWGPRFVLSGKVIRVLKGEKVDKITINDSDDTVTECFSRELGSKYIAFLDKTASNSYHSLWARDSVFQVNGFEGDWIPSKCYSEKTPYSDCVEHKGHQHRIDSKCERPLSINERMVKILKVALNNASKNVEK